MESLCLSELDAGPTGDIGRKKLRAIVVSFDLKAADPALALLEAREQRLAIAAAYRFAQVACFGIGVGAGEEFLPAGAAEWPQWPGDPGDGSPAIGDLIDCRSGSAAPGAGLLLTACAASATPDDVRLRKRWFPAAAAEDMEGFAVAFACRLRGVPLDVIRGISNTAGDRDKTRWDIPGGLRAAGDLAVQTIAEAP